MKGRTIAKILVAAYSAWAVLYSAAAVAAYAYSQAEWQRYAAFAAMGLVVVGTSAVYLAKTRPNAKPNKERAQENEDEAQL